MLKNLLNYQEVDAKLYEIEVKLSGSEERKKAISAKKYIDGVEENVNKLDDNSANIFASYEQATSEHAKLLEQLDELTKALDSAKEENEVEFLIKKVDALLGAIKNISIKIEKLAEEMQSSLKEYASIKKTTKVAQEQYAKFGSMYNEMKKAVAEEKKNLEEQLAELAKKVDNNLMDAYKAKRANKIFPVLYQVRGNVCGACNMELSMLELNKLKNGEIIACDQCGRLIYSAPTK